MSFLDELLRFTNTKVLSKDEALSALDRVRDEIEKGDEVVTVGEVIRMSIDILSVSTVWVTAALALFGVVVGFLAGGIAI